jgi:hypothetical protein
MASVGLIGSSPTAAAPYCGITWGSTVKSDPAMTQGQIFNLRSGRHDCYDRLVIDVGAGPTAGYDVRYVDVVRDDGSGDPVYLRGGAFLQLSVNAIAHDDAGNPTYRPPNRDEAVNVSGYQTFRQVRFRGDYEGITTIGLGVRARLPFRVLVLPGPGAGHRVVVDVAHRWTA